MPAEVALETLVVMRVLRLTWLRQLLIRQHFQRVIMKLLDRRHIFEPLPRIIAWYLSNKQLKRLLLIKQEEAFHPHVIYVFHIKVGAKKDVHVLHVVEEAVQRLDKSAGLHGIV